MTTTTHSLSDTDVFTALRPRLFSIAYRMLGTRADAEDLLQDAWLRWHASDASSVQSAEAWLVTIVTRLAIDRLRAAKAERETYVGFWLPEPLVEEIDERSPELLLEQASDISVAFLWVLERLAPEERAAYLLREMFEQDYAEVAELLGKNEAAVRQMVSRAARRVQEERRRFEVTPATHRALLEKFVHAAHSGERDAIKALLADNVELVGDGGGKVPSFGEVLRGADRITNLFWALSKRLGDVITYRLVQVNGEPGLLRYVDGQLESAQAFVTDGERITAMYVVRNPDKLAGIALPYC